MRQPAPGPDGGRPATGPLRPAVIAIEGCCFAGKTSLALALSQHLDVTAIPEYADLAPLPPFPARDLDDVRAALDHLLGVERRRAAAMRRGLRERKVVLCDRSPLSCIAFQHAIGRLGIPSDARLAAELFAAAAERGEILEPDAYIYLHIDRATALARQAVRGPVLGCLMDPSVLAAMQAFYQQFLNSLPADRRLVLDAAEPRGTLIEQAARFTHAQQALGPCPPGTWRASLGWPEPEQEPARERRP
jgi:thymidylate kinase